MVFKQVYRGNVRAPDFPPDAEWINTPRPLSLTDLRGKLVLLDFWTYGCINCIHILPDLKKLERKYAQELVIIGVHSAKFANESEAANLRQIVQRYEIEHPVVNDPDLRIWRAYAVRAWPATVLIDPRGYIIAGRSGERVLEAYDTLIADSIKQYEAEGILNRQPLDLTTEREERPLTGLAFPGKVLTDQPGDRLFIADSNHHRVIVTSLEGVVLDVIGSGQQGLNNGPFESATFNKPQGMALTGNLLFIADTENHTIRVADLDARKVDTAAGDGYLAYHAEMLPLQEARLNSPWDLVMVEGNLYIAMAGTHQLWRLDLAQGMIGPYAGSGTEGLIDAPLLRAALAQPSGITSNGRVLYFADSESSAVRQADLAPDGWVRTIIGQGLFDFGDRDGTWEQARLQHCLGITYYGDTLYVADTYNHKIKIVDPQDRTVTTFLGSGQPGLRDGTEPMFYEPGGLSGANGKLYVADTNNHAIRAIELATGSVSTLELQDPDDLLIGGGEETEILRLNEQRVQPGQGSIVLQAYLPPNHKLNESAPSYISWKAEDSSVIQLPDEAAHVPLAGQTFPVSVDVTFFEGHTVLLAELSLYYCRTSGSDLCLLEFSDLEIPITVTQDAPGREVRLDIKVRSPEEEPA
ncbi:MAG: redoxin domain-containing protein [Chloroflexi bacterium]|nr:redoxin domain-containing protein [Chloroflexota bacterium]